MNGGFMWLYDDFVGNGLAAQYAAAINAAVASEGSFTISGPNNVSITQGSTAQALITITPLDGFDGAVTLSLSRLPRGVKARIQGEGTYRQKLLFRATPTATTGSRPVTITGTSGSLTETFDFTLTVNPSAN
jgi:serine protease AprX